MSLSSRSGVAAVLAVLVTSIALAMSASAASAAATSSGGICRIEGFPGADAKRPSLAAGGSTAAHGSSIAGTLGKFVTEKAVGVKIERYAVIGMSGLLRMIDSSIITPDSPEQRVLEQLNAISAQISDVRARVERIGDRVNQLIGERREGALDHELTALCDIAGDQVDVYRRYRIAVEEGIKLGRLLEGPNYATADVPGGRPSMTPRERAKAALTAFQQEYVKHKPEAQFARLRRALIANPAHPNPPPLQTLFGRVLMSRERFLTRSDSARMRDLFAEFAEVRALASWMGAEYWASLGSGEDGVPSANEIEEGKVWDSFLRNSKEAEAGRARFIPPGTILDVGTEGQDTARGRPLWVAPTPLDLTWLPPNNVGAAEPLSLDGVTDELRHLRSRAEFGGRDWHAPSSQEFLALVHKGCSADPDHPSRPLVGCSQAVPGNANLAAYLQGINPDARWQQLFCQSSVNPKCPPGAGPKAPRQGPREFIWTSDRHSQRMICGLRNFGLFNAKEVDRRFTTYAGFRTLGPIRAEIFPHLPQKTPVLRRAPGKDLSKIAYIEEECTDWFKGVVNPIRSGHKNPHFEGVLLATAFTNAQDINPISKLDLMAQFPK